MDTARRYADRGQLDRAIREYSRIVAEEPNDVRIWLKIGDLYVKKGAKREATETYMRVARFYSEQGFYLKAVAVYKQILKLNPRLIEVNLKLAELYRQLGLISDAMQHFEVVAGYFHREGKTSDALATVRQLVELDPQNVATRIKLAELYSKEGMVDEAVVEFGHACDFLRASEREDDFIKVAERLLWHKADNIPLSRELAYIYLQRKDARRALQKLQVCFKADARDIETLELLAQAFHLLGQRAKTVSVLKETARVLEEDNQHPRALDVVRRVLALAPKDRDALAQLSRLQGNVQTSAPPPMPPPVPQRELTVGMPGGNDRRVPQPTGSVPLVGNEGQRNPAAEQHPPAAGSGVVKRPRLVSNFPEEPEYESSVAGEEHSDVIAQILTETDVYVKYGLHEKASTHLQRIFEYDPVNVEARERLKEIFVLQGRREDAVIELMQLAELVATYTPERAIGYLREVLQLVPHHQPAIEMATRLGVTLDVDARGNVTVDGALSAEDSYHDDSVEFIDIEIDDVVESVSPDDTRVLNRPGSHGHDGQVRPYTRDGILESADTSVIDTAVISIDIESSDIEEAANTVIGDGSVPLGAVGDAGQTTAVIQMPIFDDDLDSSFDFEAEAELDFSLDDSAELETVVSSSNDRLVSDIGAGDQSEPTVLNYRPNRGSTGGSDSASQAAISAAEGLGAFASTSEIDMLAGGFDASASDATRVNSALDATRVNPVEERTVSEMGKSGGSLDDNFDEADFFTAQGLYGEARDILQQMLVRHPNHPLIQAKINEIGELEQMQQVPSLNRNLLQGEGENTGGGRRGSARQPSVMLQRPVEAQDTDTHFNLGLAYKEMGLYDEAIQEFLNVGQAPGREVQCRLMIGLCFREQGNFLNAVEQFKAGLHVPGISQQEQFALYYEIAVTYETGIGDLRESLYFYEFIYKRAPDYVDVEKRVSTVKQRLAGRADSALPEDDATADLDLDDLFPDFDKP